MFNPDTESEPKWDQLANFVLEDQGALNGALISIGYVSSLNQGTVLDMDCKIKSHIINSSLNLGSNSS